MALSAASMAARRQAAVDAVPAPQSDNPADTISYSQACLLADSQAIIDEIVANSELVPVSTDSGTAGSGIITGKVK